MSIINPDNHFAFNQGYQKGKKDFFNGRGKKGPELFSRVSAMAIFSPNLGSLVGVDNRQMYIDEWFKGYEKGYEESQSFKNAKEIFNNNNTILKSTNMAPTSYAYQLELMESLKSYLDGFQQRLAAFANNYNKKVNELAEADMMAEVLKTFEEYYVSVTIRKIKDIIELVNERDIPFIEKQINYLEDKISELENDRE